MKPQHTLPSALVALPIALSAVRAQAETPAASTQLPTMTVTASNVEEDGYVAPESNDTALKSDVPLLETPQAVSVISEQLISDQNNTKLEEVLRNVAGVSTGGYYGNYDYYRIRGFDASLDKVFWDGLRGDNGVAPEMFGMERVDVIKGPASALYGAAPLGGLVNMTSKRPRDTFGGEIGGRIGSFNTYEATADVYGPLYTPGSGDIGGVSGVTGRLVALYRQSDTFVDFSDTERLYLAPSVTFRFSEDTTLTLLGSYTHDEGTTGMPLPAYGTALYSSLGRIPVDRFIGIPGQGNYQDFERLRLGYEFSHKFNDVVTLRQNFNYTRIDQYWDRVLYPPFGGAFTGDILLTPYTYDDTSHRVGVDTALDYHFTTGPVKHTATTGFDYYYNKGTSRGVFDFANAVTLNVFNPNYNQIVGRPATLGAASDSGYETYGVYVQDHMKLTDTVSLTLGGRFTGYEERVSGTSETSFNPKAGAAWEFYENTALFANYGTSFQPQTAGTPAQVVDPLEGENIETGVKYAGFDGRLTAMATIFQVTQENVVVPTGGIAFTQSGEQRSRGVELETGLELIPGLQVTTAYTYLDAEVREDATIAKGTALLGVPENTFSAWAKYTLQDGPLKGFGIGLGGRVLDSQSGDSANTFNLPAYAVLDAGLFYDTERFSAQLNFKNFTNERYFSGSFSDYYVLPGEPLNISASATWKF